MTATVQLGDWRDVLPGTYDPEHAIVVTDPPYGIGRQAYDDRVPWTTHVAEVLELLPAVRHVIRGPGSLIASAELARRPRRVCVELVGMGRRATFRPDVVPYRWQGWLVYGRLRIGRRREWPRGDWYLSHPYAEAGGRVGDKHDAVTPYPVARWIVDLWTEPGWTVVDPFAGVGTIGRVAVELGFDYRGAEVDERWASSWALLDTQQLRLEEPVA